MVRTTKRGDQKPRLSLALFSAGVSKLRAFGPKTLQRRVLCLCSTGPVRGLGLGLGAHTVPLTVAFDAICVLKG